MAGSEARPPLGHGNRQAHRAGHELKARGVALKATEQPVDTGTAAGEAFLRHARRLHRVRDQSAARAAARRDQRRQGARRLQRSQTVHRRRRSAAAAPGGKARPGGDCPATRHWAGKRLLPAKVERPAINRDEGSTLAFSKTQARNGLRRLKGRLPSAHIKIHGQLLFYPSAAAPK